jgi:hypothetical protein
MAALYLISVIGDGRGNAYIFVEPMIDQASVSQLDTRLGSVLDRLPV